MDQMHERFKRMLCVYDTDTQSANFRFLRKFADCVSVSNKRSFEPFMCLDLVDLRLGHTLQVQTNCTCYTFCAVFFNGTLLW